MQRSLFTNHAEQTLLLYNQERTILEHWPESDVPKDVWDMLDKWFAGDHKMYVLASWRLSGALVFDYRLDQEFDW